MSDQIVWAIQNIDGEYWGPWWYEEEAEDELSLREDNEPEKKWKKVKFVRPEPKKATVYRAAVRWFNTMIKESSLPDLHKAEDELLDAVKKATR